MAVDFKNVALKVIENVGGKENIKSIAHCATRLRLVVNEPEKVEMDALKTIPGVLSVAIVDGQFQIVLGPAVKDVFEIVSGEVGLTKEKVTGIKGFFKRIFG